MKTTQSIWISLGLASLGVAQGSPDIPLDAWPVPIHSAPDDPQHGAYGHWAAGRDWKASFGAEFTFYPRLGARYPRNMPVTWRSAGVFVDGEPWLTPAAAPRERATDWRWETRHGDAWVEAYDVDVDGVEQSFVLNVQPPSGGEVVIHGRIETELKATIREPAHAEIEFRSADDGATLVRYGRAFAIDADGDRIEIGSSFDGGSIGLHVPGEWLARATFPVTVDPLVQRGNLGGELDTIDVLDTDTATATAAAAGNSRSILVVHSRVFTTGDIDAFGFTYDGDFSNARRIWQDTASFETRRPRCAYCEPSDSWVIAFERRSGTVASVRAYSHARTVVATNAGTTHYLTQIAGFNNLRPDVGGQTRTNGAATPIVMVVYERGSITAGSANPIYGVTLDPSTNTWGTPRYFSGGSGASTRSPAIATSDFGTGEWVVACLSRSFVSTVWRPAVGRMNATGTTVAATTVGTSAGANYTSTEVCVDGSIAHAIVGYEDQSTSVFLNRRARYDRVAWLDGTPGLQVLRSATLASGTLASSISLYSVAFDLDTLSHWCFSHRRDNTLTVTRTGFTGGIVEQATVATSPGISASAVSSAIDVDPAFDRWGRFEVVWADNSFLFPIRAAQFEYPAAGTLVTGGGCHFGRLEPSATQGQPLAGNARFAMSVTGPPPGAQVTLVLAFGPGFVPLASIGAPLCTLHVDPVTMVTLGTTLALPFGTEFLVPLPDDPVFVGDLYFQALWIRPGLNPLGLGATNGLLARVR